MYPLSQIPPPADRHGQFLFYWEAENAQQLQHVSPSIKSMIVHGELTLDGIASASNVPRTSIVSYVA
jgi:hypothetical protein